VTQKSLSDAGLNKGVALSMQSLDPVTLENIKRDNISLNTYLELSRRFTQEKVETYSDLILALPGETYESYVNGIDVLIEAGQHNRIQFNNLSILPNAEMGDPAYLAKFKMVTVCSNIINIHGTKEVYEDDVPETQQVVIQTYSMSSKDWRVARAISWMISFLYFDKLFQIPIQLVREIGNVPYRHIFEGFMNVESNVYPVLAEIRDFFLREAQSIQDGGVEYVFSQKWLGIYWPADEYAYIQITESKRFAELNSEVNSLLVRMLGSSPLDEHIEIISDALKINHSLISQPYVDKDIIFKTQFNIIEHWRGICSGVAVPLARGSYSYLIPRSRYFYDDLQTWCKEIVWWGNKKGAYLYPALVKGSPELPSEGGVELAGNH